MREATPERGPAANVASLIIRHPVAVITTALLLAAALAFGIPRLQFRTGQDTLLDPQSKIALDNQRFQRQFGGDPMLILFEAPADGPDIRALFTRENRDALQRLQADLEATGEYQSVISPLLVLQFAQQQISDRMISEPLKLAEDERNAADLARAASAQRGETAAQQAAAASAAVADVDAAFQAAFGADAKRLTAAGEQTLDNPKFVEFVMFGANGELRPDLAGIFPDQRHALMVVRVRGNLSIDEGARAGADVRERLNAYTFTGVTALASGPPLLIKEINDKMRSALLMMAVFAVAIMTAVLFLVFRARWRLLSLPSVLIGSVAAFGLMGFVGIPLTMVTISGLPILIGLGVDFAIQVHSRIEEETSASGSAEAGLTRAFSRLGPALSLAALAAGIGFIVLRLSQVPMIRDFGSMLAVGAVIVFVMSIALISAVVFLRERTRIGDAAPPRARFEVERIVGGITGRAVGRLAPIALVALIVAAGGLYLSGRIPTQTDPQKFVPSDSSVLKDLNKVSQVAGTTSELNLFVEMDAGRKVTDQDVLDWMLAFEERERAEHPQLLQSNSLASFTKSVTGAAPTTASAERALSSAPAALSAQVVNGDRTLASMTFAIDDTATLADRSNITQAMERDANPPPGVAVNPAGIAVIGTEAVDAISGNRELMSLAALGAILLVLLVVFRNPVKAIAPLLPVVLALGASAMLIYFSGMEYSPLTSISGPLIIAMGTEFNILLMSRYFEERGYGVTAREAMSRASLRIGRAIAASGLTVMGGFAVLALSDFPLLDNFGRVTALNIGLSLLSTLVLLPPLLVWADEDVHFVHAPASEAAAK